MFIWRQFDHYDTRGDTQDQFNVKVIAMARILDMHRKWMEEPAYRRAYDALEEEFALAAAAIDARLRLPKAGHQRFDSRQLQDPQVFRKAMI
jgi:hypothetical protein